LISEVIEFSSVVADIYDAAIEPAMWQQALASICAYVGGSSAVLYWHDAASERSKALHLFNENPEYTRLYFEKYLPMNPMFPAAAFVDVGRVVSTSDIMPYEEFVETRFFKEWSEPQGIVDALSVNFEKGVTRVSLVNIRTEVAIDETMRERTASLVPHLQRAVAIGRLFDQGRDAQVAQAALTEALDHVEAAVVLVGAEAAISFANDPAHKMLDDATLIRRHEDTLQAAAPETDRIFRDIFTAAAKGDASIGVRGVAVPLTSSSDKRWFAHVLPLTSGRRGEAGQANGAVAAVFIRQSAPNAPLPLEAIAKLYKLTAGELRVLDAVLRASGVKAIADMLGVSPGTVKTHLHNLFRKTGTKRQADLVKLIAGI
jgi:DNA-binding CsgD family transcriptional regulator